MIHNVFVILSSGNMLSGWAINRDWILEETKTVADGVGCGDHYNNTPVLLDCLRKVSIEDFWNAIFFTVFTCPNIANTIVS